MHGPTAAASGHRIGRIWAIVLGLVAASLAATLLASCAAPEAAIARLRPRDGFIPTAAQPDVRYRPGSEALANRIAGDLERSIKIVEQSHHATFKRAPRIFVCASACFTRYALSGDQTPAAMFGDSVFMNQDRLIERERRGMPPENFLTHELAHLLLYQRVGPLAFNRIPSWFREGLAVSVSNPDATVTTTRGEATQALLAGRAFDPAERSGLFGGRPASSDGLPMSLFYREADMYVTYLETQNPQAFRAGLDCLLARGDFQDCFARAYGRPIAAYWPGFIQSLRPSASVSAQNGPKSNGREGGVGPDPSRTAKPSGRASHFSARIAESRGRFGSPRSRAPLYSGAVVR